MLFFHERVGGFGEFGLHGFLEKGLNLMGAALEGGDRELGLPSAVMQLNGSQEAWQAGWRSGPSIFLHEFRSASLKYLRRPCRATLII